MKLKCVLLAVVLFYSRQHGIAQQTATDTAALQVQVTMPPFLYEGDRLEVVATASSTALREQTAQLQLQLLDGSTNTSVDGWFQNIFPVQYVTIEKGTVAEVRFPLEVPYQFRKKVCWQVTAQDKVLQKGSVLVRAVDDLVKTRPKPTKASIQIQKSVLHKRRNYWQPLQDTTTIHVDDSLKIRLIVTTAQTISHVKVSDALAATFAPAPLSTNKAQTTRQEMDRTHYIFTVPHLQKGRTVLEYTVATTHAGVFYVGTAVIQSANQTERSASAFIRVEE